MAISAGCIWEVRTTGSDANGGGFVAGTGTDYSQQDSAQIAFDGTTIAATTSAASATITVSGATVAAAWVGNIINITGGTNFTTGRYQVSSVNTGANTATLDRTCSTAAASAMVGRMGGAVASPGTIAGAMVNGNVAFVKRPASGVFSITTASTNVSSGCVSQSFLAVAWVGYDSNRTRTNTDPKPIIRSSVASATMFSLGASRGVLYNVELDGNSLSATVPMSIGLAVHCTFRGFTAAAGMNARGCLATGCSAAMFTQPAYDCDATGNTATPFTTITAVRCKSYANTGASTDGFSPGAAAQVNYDSCVAYGNGRDGFNPATSGDRAWLLTNCIAYGNGRYGYNSGGGTVLQRCAAGANTTAATNGTILISDLLSLTADPFINAAGGNFELNETAGGGAALIGVAYPSTSPGGTPNYADIGAAQKQTSGGAALFGGILLGRVP